MVDAGVLKTPALKACGFDSHPAQKTHAPPWGAGFLVSDYGGSRRAVSAERAQEKRVSLCDRAEANRPGAEATATVLLSGTPLGAKADSLPAK